MAADPQSFDHIAELFDEMARLEERTDFFIEHLPAARTAALDVGCGSGILAAQLSEHFDTVTGVDVSEPMLEIARRERAPGNVRYLRMDARRLSFEARFDLVASHTTLHHVEDPAAVLEALRELVAPSGRLVLVDLTCEWSRGRAPEWVLLSGPFKQLAFDAWKHGARNAVGRLRNRLSPAWLDHLRSDRYLSRDAFRRTYGAVLPGARFTQMGEFMGVVWQAPPD